MEKYKFDERNGLWYELQVHIGIWGQRHRRYLKENHRVFYVSLLSSGKLNAILRTLTGRRRRSFLMFSLLNKCQNTWTFILLSVSNC